MSFLEEYRAVMAERDVLNTRFKALQGPFSHHITNKELPLTDRWQFWVEAPMELKKPIRDYYGHPNGKVSKWVERVRLEFYWNRGATMLWKDIMEEAVDHIVSTGKFDPEFLSYEVASHEEMVELLEAILASNEPGFEYDW